MTIVVFLLAVGLGVCVWRRPEEAAGAATVFLLAAGILLPSSARFNGLDEIWQMYYWASGLLLITVAAVLRVGIRRVFVVRRSAQVFLGVAIAAVIYSLAHGATMSYALRQFYGVLLFVVYLGLAYHAGNQELLIRRIAIYGVLCAFCFFVYYIAIFPVYGFHKEMSYSGAQASFMAIVLFLTGMERKKHLWMAGGIALLGVAVLTFARSDVLTFLFAVPIAVAIKLKSMAWRALSYCAIVLVALPALFPPVTQVVALQLEELPVVGEMIPEGARTSESLYDRTVQFMAALESVKAHPLFGDGLGAGFEFESSVLGHLETVYVDSGWGYLLQKMGLLGAGAFLWLLITIFTGASRESVGFTACLISATIVTMFSSPVFFHFTTTPFLGALAGLLLARKDRGCKPATLLHPKVA
jgi:O-antigen ligase